MARNCCFGNSKSNHIHIQTVHIMRIIDIDETGWAHCVGFNQMTPNGGSLRIKE